MKKYLMALYAGMKELFDLTDEQIKKGIAQMIVMFAVIVISVLMLYFFYLFFPPIVLQVLIGGEVVIVVYRITSIVKQKYTDEKQELLRKQEIAEMNRTEWLKIYQYIIYPIYLVLMKRKFSVDELIYYGGVIVEGYYFVNQLGDDEQEMKKLQAKIERMISDKTKIPLQDVRQNDYVFVTPEFVLIRPLAYK